MDEESIVQALMHEPDVDRVLEQVQQEHHRQIAAAIHIGPPSPILPYPAAAAGSFGFSGAAGSSTSSVRRSSPSPDVPVPLPNPSYAAPRPNVAQSISQLPDAKASSPQPGTRSRIIVSPSVLDEVGDSSAAVYSWRNSLRPAPLAEYSPREQPSGTASNPVENHHSQWRPQQGLRPLPGSPQRAHYSAVEDILMSSASHHDSFAPSSIPAAGPGGETSQDDVAFVDRSTGGAARQRGSGGGSGAPVQRGSIAVSNTRKPNTTSRHRSAATPVIRSRGQNLPAPQRTPQKSTTTTTTAAAASAEKSLADVSCSVRHFVEHHALRKNYEELLRAKAPPPPDTSFFGDDGILRLIMPPSASPLLSHGAVDGHGLGNNSSTPALHSGGTLSALSTRVLPAVTTRHDPFLLHAPFAYHVPADENFFGDTVAGSHPGGGGGDISAAGIDSSARGGGARSSLLPHAQGRTQKGYRGTAAVNVSEESDATGESVSAMMEYSELSLKPVGLEIAEPLTDDEGPISAPPPQPRVIEHKQHKRRGSSGGNGGARVASSSKFRNSLIVIQAPGGGTRGPAVTPGNDNAAAGAAGRGGPSASPGSANAAGATSPNANAADGGGGASSPKSVLSNAGWLQNVDVPAGASKSRGGQRAGGGPPASPYVPSSPTQSDHVSGGYRSGGESESYSYSYSYSYSVSSSRSSSRSSHEGDALDPVAAGRRLLQRQQGPQQHATVARQRRGTAAPSTSTRLDRHRPPSLSATQATLQTTSRQADTQPYLSTRSSNTSMRDQSMLYQTSQAGTMRSASAAAAQSSLRFALPSGKNGSGGSWKALGAPKGSILVPTAHAASARSSSTGALRHSTSSQGSLRWNHKNSNSASIPPPVPDRQLVWTSHGHGEVSRFAVPASSPLGQSALSSQSPLRGSPNRSTSRFGIPAAPSTRPVPLPTSRPIVSGDGSATTGGEPVPSPSTPAPVQATIGIPHRRQRSASTPAERSEAQPAAAVARVGAVYSGRQAIFTSSGGGSSPRGATASRRFVVGVVS